MKWSDLRKRGFKTMTADGDADVPYTLHERGHHVHANVELESGMREVCVRRGRSNWTIIVLNGNDNVAGIGHGTNLADARTAAHR